MSRGGRDTMKAEEKGCANRAFNYVTIYAIQGL
jgi:hypothetical protein